MSHGFISVLNYQVYPFLYHPDITDVSQTLALAPDPPKHSMAFSKWQEQTLVQAPSEVELPPKEVMVSQVERGVNTQTPMG